MTSPLFLDKQIRVQELTNNQLLSLSKQDGALKKHSVNVFSERASRRVGVMQNQMSSGHLVKIVACATS